MHLAAADRFDALVFGDDGVRGKSAEATGCLVR
jgi:hypothetical protein